MEKKVIIDLKGIIYKKNMENSAFVLNHSSKHKNTILNFIEDSAF